MKFGKSPELAHIAKVLHTYCVEKKELLVTLETNKRTPESNIFPQTRVCIVKVSLNGVSLIAIKCISSYETYIYRRVLI